MVKRIALLKQPGKEPFTDFHGKLNKHYPFPIKSQSFLLLRERN
jgi:hypothetical protein